jgi:hypothetical protein
MSKLIVALSMVKDGSMLARHDPLDEDVIKNREAFLTKNSISMDQATRVNVDTYQRAEKQHETNWTRYYAVSTNERGDGMRDDNKPVADALVTRENNHALFLGIADCVGAVIYDPTRRVLMLTHLGRHSLEQHGGEKSIQYLVDNYNCNPSDLKVWLTPAPNKEVFPIWALDNKGMKEATFEQLAAAGIVFENIIDNPADSATDLNYYSYSEFLKGHRTEDGDVGMVAMMRD